MSVKLTLGILSLLTVINFSCKQSQAKEGDVHIVNAKANGKPAKLFSLVGRADTLHKEDSNTGAARPTCCKGAPSRFRSNGGKATGKK